MCVDELRAVIVRDLDAAAREVEAYASDHALWRVVPGVTNAGGALALHLAGNLRHFVGHVLGGTAYVRDREAEFAVRAVPEPAIASGPAPVRGASDSVPGAYPMLSRAVVAAELRAAAAEVDDVLRRLPPERLAEPFPSPPVGTSPRTAQFLVHLAAHLGYHLGQIDYHRRMTDPASGTVGTMSLKELPA